MRIIHVNSESGFSGGEHQVFLLIRFLKQLGVENLLVGPAGSRSEAVAAEEGVPFRAVAMRNYTDLSAIGRLRRLFQSCQPDLVHLHTGRATWLGGISAWRCGVPAVTTRRMDRDVNPGLRTSLIYRMFVQRAVAIAPAVSECLARGGVPAGRRVVIWDAVDPEALRGSTRRAELRAEFGVPEDELVLLTMAALVRRKGLDVLLEALALCRREGFSPRVWIGGEGAEREALEQQSERLGLSDRVRFLGWREDGPDLLAAADLFALPSRREGVGVAALEAMAAGKALVGSAVGGLGEAIVDGESGLLVPAEDVGALAEALLRLGANRALRARLSAGAMARVDETFSALTQAQAYRDLYEEVIAEGALRS